MIAAARPARVFALVAATAALALTSLASAGPHGGKYRPPAGHPGAPQPPPVSAPANAVVLFEHGDYRGPSQLLTAGRYDRHALSFGHDRLSALRVPPGMRVTLYEHADFRGRTLTVSVDTPWLPADFDDATSAIAVEQLQPMACAPPPPCPSCPPCAACPQAPAYPPQRHPERQTPLPPPPAPLPPPVMVPPPPAPPPPPPAPRAMGEAMFRKLTERLREVAFAKAQIAAIRDEVRVGSRFDTRQVIAVMEIVSFPDHQVDACVEMWPAVVDPQNAPDVIAALTFESHRNRLRKALRL